MSKRRPRWPLSGGHRGEASKSPGCYPARPSSNDGRLPPSARIQWVGFDGDDTLWKSEDYYRQAEADFEAILAAYIDLADPRTHGHLLEVERRNLKIFGYGVKGMTLSMLETAIQLTDERISARDLHRVVEIGRAAPAASRRPAAGHPRSGGADRLLGR